MKVPLQGDPSASQNCHRIPLQLRSKYLLVIVDDAFACGCSAWSPHARQICRHFWATPRHRQQPPWPLLTFHCSVPFFLLTFLVQIERDGQTEHRVMTLDLTTQLSLFFSRSSTREALIDSAIPRSYRWIPKPLVPVARVLSPPLAWKAYCRNQYVRIKGKRGVQFEHFSTHHSGPVPM